MWQTKYASTVPKNLGVEVNFWPRSEGHFLSGRPQSVCGPIKRGQNYVHIFIECPLKGLLYKTSAGQSLRPNKFCGSDGYYKQLGKTMQGCQLYNSIKPRTKTQELDFNKKGRLKKTKTTEIDLKKKKKNPWALFEIILFIHLDLNLVSYLLFTYYQINLAWVIIILFFFKLLLRKNY